MFSGKRYTQRGGRVNTRAKSENPVRAGVPWMGFFCGSFSRGWGEAGLTGGRRAVLLAG
jgi:hypothetical protein